MLHCDGAIWSFRGQRTSIKGRIYHLFHVDNIVTLVIIITIIVIIVITIIIIIRTMAAILCLVSRAHRGNPDLSDPSTIASPAGYSPHQIIILSKHKES